MGGEEGNLRHSSCLACTQTETGREKEIATCIDIDPFKIQLHCLEISAEATILHYRLGSVSPLLNSEVIKSLFSFLGTALKVLQRIFHI